MGFRLVIGRMGHAILGVKAYHFWAHANCSRRYSLHHLVMMSYSSLPAILSLQTAQYVKHRYAAHRRKCHSHRHVNLSSGNVIPLLMGHPPLLATRVVHFPQFLSSSLSLSFTS